MNETQDPTDRKEEETGIDANCANQPCCGTKGCSWHNEQLDDDSQLLNRPPQFKSRGPPCISYNDISISVSQKLIQQGEES